MAVKGSKPVYNKDVVTVEVSIPMSIDYIKINLSINDLNKGSNMMGKTSNCCHCKSPKPLKSEADGNPFTVCAKSKGGCGKEIGQNNYGRKDIAPLTSYDEGFPLTIEEIESIMGWNVSFDDLEKAIEENLANFGPSPDLDLLFPTRNGVSKSALDAKYGKGFKLELKKDSKYCSECLGFGKKRSKIPGFYIGDYPCPDCNGSGMASA